MPLGNERAAVQNPLLRDARLHPGGATFLFADGSVRFLSYSVRFRLRDLATIAGGETFQE